jgi:hypothetical protein
MKAYALTHSYGQDDRSVVRVYLDKQRADDDLELVKQFETGQWELHEVPLVGEVNRDDI